MIVGKLAKLRLGVQVSEALVVGATLVTDIELAKAGGNQMKLLLTSAGVKNASIHAALLSE